MIYFAITPEIYREFGELEKRMLWASNVLEGEAIANKIICRTLELEAQSYLVPMDYARIAVNYKEMVNKLKMDSQPY